MNLSPQRIVEITGKVDYEKYLHRCLVGPPSKQYKKRAAYLKKAIPKGFHKKLLICNGQALGTIEYAPPEVSYYPIIGSNMIVMNCIWVLRKAKGHNFGRMLIENMIESEQDAPCFATIALEDHWSPWFQKWQMEKLGFKPLESMNITHKLKHKGRVFSIHLMWMPTVQNARPPTWNEKKLLEGITACIAHPLYHPQTYNPTQILEKR